MNITEDFLIEASRFVKRQSLYGRSKSSQLWGTYINSFIQEPDSFHYYENKITKVCYLTHKTKRQFLVLTYDGHLITPGDPVKIRQVLNGIYKQELTSDIRQLNNNEVAKKYPYFFSKDFSANADKEIK